MPKALEPRSPGGSARGRGVPEGTPRSPTAAAPAICPHFGPCGGCTFLDVAYDEQLRRKRDEVERVFREALPGEAFEVAPVLPDPRPHHYRNKAIYPLRRPGGTGPLLAGFYRRGSHALVDVHRCDIQDRALTAIANRLRTAIDGSGASIYDETSRTGSLRYLFLRIGTGTGEAMVAFVTTPGRFPEGRELSAAAVEAAAGVRTRLGLPVRVVSVLHNLNPSAGNEVLGRRTVPLRGRPHLEENLGGMRLRVSLPSFLQVNSRMALRTYALVRELAGGRAAGRVVDAYSGIGPLALHLARGASEVIGIEEVPEAVEDAAWNARSNGVANTRFVAGRVEEALPALDGPLDLLVLDPPRSGCAPEVLDAAARLAPAAIVFVSCNARTLARDLAHLAPRYRVAAVRPVDLFPQTEHVEVVTLLEPRTA